MASAHRDAIRKRLNEPNRQSRAGLGAASCAASVRQPACRSPRSPLRARQTILSELDMTQRADAKHYKVELERLQGRLNRLHRQAQRRGVSTILVFEGWDSSLGSGTPSRSGSSGRCTGPERHNSWTGSDRCRTRCRRP